MTRRGAIAACACALALTAGPAAGAGPIASVAIDHVSVARDGVHEVWVSVLDANDAPVAGLERGSFSAAEDGARARVVDALPFDRRYDAVEWTVLVDPDLLQAPASAALARTLAALAALAGPRDRVRLVGADAPGRAIDGAVSEGGRLLASLEASGAGGVPRLGDALFEGVRHALRAPASRGSVVLVISRGDDAGSRHAPLDAWALAHARGRRVPVFALVLEGGAVDQAERLASLAARSGGAALPVESVQALEAGARRLIARARGAWWLRIAPGGWDANADHHVLEVAAHSAGARLAGRRSFDTADVVLPSWWHDPRLEVVPVALALVALAGFAVRRRRRWCRLVMAGGEDRGCWYEMFGAPITLGAAEGNDLVFPERRVSRNHAVIERRGRVIELVDLNSENGTFVNGERIARRRLEHGDRVGLGGVVEMIVES